MIEPCLNSVDCSKMCIIFQVDISVIVYMPVCLPSLGHNFKGNHEIYGKYTDEPSKSV